MAAHALLRTVSIWGPRMKLTCLSVLVSQVAVVSDAGCQLSLSPVLVVCLRASGVARAVEAKALTSRVKCMLLIGEESLTWRYWFG
jgi:hypothetical protein